MEPFIDEQWKQPAQPEQERDRCRRRRRLHRDLSLKKYAEGDRGESHEIIADHPTPVRPHLAATDRGQRDQGGRQPRQRGGPNAERIANGAGEVAISRVAPVQAMSMPTM
jgi:hypothetical protein